MNDMMNMKEETVCLPNGENVNVFYQMKFTPGIGYAHPLCWLQLKKMGFEKGFPEHAANYQHNLPKVAGDFVNAFESESCSKINIFFLPASNSRQFDPYADALKSKNNNIQIVDGVFDKPDDFSAGSNDGGYNKLLEVTTIDKEILPCDLSTKTHIGIIDDIFNTGATAAVIIELLKPHISTEVEFSIICPLLVEHNKK